VAEFLLLEQRERIEKANIVFFFSFFGDIQNMKVDNL
jgi:hypothetical protein